MDGKIRKSIWGKLIHHWKFYIILKHIFTIFIQSNFVFILCQVYEGRQPQVFVCDPDLVRLICVKDAAYFDSKRLLDFGDPVLNEMPDFQPRE